jgi:hypothetical protein
VASGQKKLIGTDHCTHKWVPAATGHFNAIGCSDPKLLLPIHSTIRADLIGQLTQFEKHNG